MEVTLENLEIAVKNVRTYDPKTQPISILKYNLDALEDLLKYGVDIDDLIDFSDLPTLPIPDGKEAYPIWSMDFTGDCLVGDAVDQIENIKEIILTWRISDGNASEETDNWDQVIDYVTNWYNHLVDDERLTPETLPGCPDEIYDLPEGDTDLMNEYISKWEDMIAVVSGFKDYVIISPRSQMGLNLSVTQIEKE